MTAEELISLPELMGLLGYSDERSVKSWCKKRGIPIVRLGLKKYVPKHLLTQYIDNQLVIFVQGKKTENFTCENENPKKKTTELSKNSYQPKNELISNYLAKYESANQHKPTK